MFEGNNITTDDYNIENMRRVTLINIDKKSCVNFINLITKKKINENEEEIFGNKICDLFLNIKIKNEYSFESSLFLNRNNNDIYDLTPKELDILKIFKEGLIMKYINKYKNYSINDIDKEIENNFIKELNAFALRYFSDFEKRMKTEMNKDYKGILEQNYLLFIKETKSIRNIKNQITYRLLSFIIYVISISVLNVDIYH